MKTGVKAVVSIIVGSLFLVSGSLMAALELPGLTKKAEIVRDAEGIAHINARNEQDLYYLQDNTYFHNMVEDL